MIYILSCVWLDYMVQYFQCKNCVGSSPKTKKCVASFLVPVYITHPPKSGLNAGFSGGRFICKNAVWSLFGRYYSENTPMDTHKNEKSGAYTAPLLRCSICHVPPLLSQGNN